MLAHWAELRSLLADYNVAAVDALPHHVAVAREYQFALNVGQELAIAGFVLSLDFAYQVKQGSDSVEAFFASLGSKAGVHVGPFVVFAVGSIHKVVGSARNITAMEKLEPDFCMFFLVAGCFGKYLRNLHIAVFLCLAGIVLIFCVGLRFACKCFLKIFLSLCSFKIFHTLIEFIKQFLCY